MSLLPVPNNGSAAQSYFIKNDGDSELDPVIHTNENVFIKDMGHLLLTTQTGMGGEPISSIINNDTVGSVSINAAQASPAYIVLSTTDGIVNGIAPRNKIYASVAYPNVPSPGVEEIPNPVSLPAGLYAVFCDLTAIAASGSVSCVSYWNGTYWSGGASLPFGTGAVALVPSLINNGANMELGNSTGAALAVTVRFYQILGSLGA